MFNILFALNTVLEEMLDLNITPKNRRLNKHFHSFIPYIMWLIFCYFYPKICVKYWDLKWSKSEMFWFDIMLKSKASKSKVNINTERIQMFSSSVVLFH